MEAGSQRIGFGPFEPMFTMDLEGSKIYAFLATFLDGKQHMRNLGGQRKSHRSRLFGHASRSEVDGRVE